jgi:hypothetical protein
MQTVQLGDINALAVKTETPAEDGDQKTYRNDPPALVADGSFVDGDRNRTPASELLS